MKWEYKNVYSEKDYMMETLQREGLEGWELCHRERYLDGEELLLKRLILSHELLS